LGKISKLTNVLQNIGEVLLRQKCTLTLLKLSIKNQDKRRQQKGRRIPPGFLLAEYFWLQLA
jgi:hypothetical protein